MSSVLVPSSFLVGKNNQPIGVAYASTSINGIKVQYQIFGKNPEFKEVILENDNIKINQLIWLNSHKIAIIYNGKRYFDVLNIDDGDLIKRLEIENNKSVITYGCKNNFNNKSDFFTIIDSDLNIIKYDINNELKKVEEYKINLIDEKINCFNWIDEFTIILGGTKLYKYDLINELITNEISISINLINNIIIENNKIIVSSNNERFVNIIDNNSNSESWKIIKILTFDSDVLKLSVNNSIVSGITEAGIVENFIINDINNSSNNQNNKKQRRSSNKLNIRCNNIIKIKGNGNIIEDVYVNDSKTLSIGYLTSKRSFIITRTGIEDFEINPDLNIDKNVRNGFQSIDDAALPSFENNGELVDGNVIITHDSKDNDDDDEDEDDDADDFGTIVARAKSVISEVKNNNNKNNSNNNNNNNKLRGNTKIAGTLTTSVLQSIRGRDMSALSKILNETNDENIIKATVSGLDGPAASGLLQALGELSGRSGGGIESITTWVRWVLALHGGGAQTSSIIALHRSMTARARNLEKLVEMRARLNVVSTKAQLGRLYTTGNGDIDDEDDEDVLYVEELEDAENDIDIN